MRIVVTKKDIINATRSNATRTCPIALALSRAYKEPMACGRTIYWFASNEKLHIPAMPLPQKAKSFVDNYDNGKEVTPFQFNI